MSNNSNNKKKFWEQPEISEPQPGEAEVEPVAEMIQEKDNVPLITDASYYEKYLWKGIIPGHKCLKCDLHIQGENPDDIILHVVSHLVGADKEKVFAALVSETNKQ